ncbi:hypothetical protein OG596_15845 [Streptomyces sp. NBC_01102]|uniref:hypothetical protein n=1 Tax=unclassified Streptomyces TaxID=2593676 RepID=UPI0038701D16|nr:hypothetical protein OG596_15845 [Streptomyces sp. NBC_01102]
MLPAGFLLTVITTVACAVALGTGVVGAYEPPRPTEVAMRGVWASEDGRAEVRLRADGRAELSGCRARAGNRRAAATARVPGRTPPRTARPGADHLDVPGEDCPTGAWTVGGTGQRPQLYALFGDPDAGGVRILGRRDGS